MCVSAHRRIEQTRIPSQSLLRSPAVLVFFYTCGFQGVGCLPPTSDEGLCRLTNASTMCRPTDTVAPTQVDFAITTTLPPADYYQLFPARGAVVRNPLPIDHRFFG